MNVRCSDVELIARTHLRDEDAWNDLLKRYERLVYMLIHKHMHVIKVLRLDVDDVFQEGNLGLVDAISNFDEHRCMPLYPFAKICVERRIQSYFRKNSSLAHTLFRNAFSLDQSISEDEQMYLHDVIASPPSLKSPQDYMTHVYLREQVDEVLSHCSEIEKAIFSSRLQGYSYEWIAQKYNVKSKRIDNTMGKIKRSLKKVI